MKYKVIGLVKNETEADLCYETYKLVLNKKKNEYDQKYIIKFYKFLSDEEFKTKKEALLAAKELGGKIYGDTILGWTIKYKN